LQIHATPLVGLYNDIDFGIVMFMEEFDGFKPPKIYNDRRIFHPNINPYTLEILFPAIVS
jgi:ubiquitin-protein ligase